MIPNNSRRGLHGYVVDLLGKRILSGQIRPGERLDLEQLSETEDISRSVLREALRVLTEKGLLEARPRRGTYVTSREQWKLLDDDIMRWRASGKPDPLLVHELGELRQIFEPAAARLAATRRTDSDIASMADAFSRMQRAEQANDAALLAEADAEFHSAVLSAAGNELLARFESMLEPALIARNITTHQHIEGNDFLSQHEAVLKAIRDGAADQAGTSMADLVELAHMHAAEAQTVSAKE